MIKRFKLYVLVLLQKFYSWNMRRHARLSDKYMRSEMAFGRWKKHSAKAQEYMDKNVATQAKISDLRGALK